jgi:hypothetical protein
MMPNRTEGFMKSLSLIIFLILAVNLSSCAKRVKKAIDEVKYSAWEKVGVEKRDLFKREVSNVKDDQEESGESFKDALTKLKEVYAFDGGNLEREYNKLHDAYDGAKADSLEVSSSINKLNTVASDLFEEWEAEIKEYSSADLRRKSSEQLSLTKTKYHSLYRSLKSSEAKMAPILVKFNDQVMFLKHNLNAQAIGGLKTEGKKIQSEIEKLISEMNQSNQEAEAFIKTL